MMLGSVELINIGFCLEENHQHKPWEVEKKDNKIGTRETLRRWTVKDEKNSANKGDRDEWDGAV